jgi:hypothetical protein
LSRFPVYRGSGLGRFHCIYIEGIRVKGASVKTTQSAPTKLPTCPVTLHKTSPPHTAVFENESFPTMAVQRRQHMNAAGCGGLIKSLSLLHFQIPSGCVQMCCVLVVTYTLN